MTGFGRAEGEFQKKHYSVELKSLNNRYCEISVKLPKYLMSKELELKELIRTKISRGKIYLNINTDKELSTGDSINTEVVRSYYNSIKTIRKAIGSKEKIKLEHILSFSDAFSNDEIGETGEEEYNFIKELINKALGDLIKMKENEGNFLYEDIKKRIGTLEEEAAMILEYGKNRVSKERERIYLMLNEIMTDKTLISENRVEMEVVLYAEKLDITEECTRLDSHLKYFRNFMDSKENAGRRLNFLLQEMNREINTIASKSSDAVISQTASALKEELEKVREQIQNVE
jgi:uncharacterized protein (TIGR00255 family)